MMEEVISDINNKKGIVLEYIIEMRFVMQATQLRKTKTINNSPSSVSINRA